MSSHDFQEAFGLWLTQWQSIYDSSGSVAADVAARRVLQSIHDGWWLVSIVDNNYVDDSADVFDVFREVVSPGALRDAHAHLSREYSRVLTELTLSRDSERRMAAENEQLKKQLLLLRGEPQMAQNVGVDSGRGLGYVQTPLHTSLRALPGDSGKRVLPV